MDIIPKFLKKPLDDKKLLVLGRLTTLVIGIIVPSLALVMSISGKSAFQWMNTFNAIISIAYGPPALIGFLKKTPHWTGLVYFVIAIIMGSIGWFGLGWDIPENVLYVVPLSMIIMFGGDFISKRFLNEKEQYIKNRNEFFKKLETPIDVKKEVGSSGNIQSVVFGFLSKVTGSMGLFSLIFIALNPIEEATIIILYSAFTLFLAFLLHILSRNKKASELLEANTTESQ